MSERTPNDKGNARKRPLVGKENYDTPLSPPLTASMMKAKESPMPQNPYSSTKKPKPASSKVDDGGVEVVSPPPPPGVAASRPVSSDGTISSANKQPGSPTDNDDCVMEWTNATNALVEFPHGRPDCGVHDFSNGDKSKFCDKCYCVVCSIPAKECQQWASHCHEVKVTNPPTKQRNHAVIDIEDSSPEQRLQQQQRPPQVPHRLLSSINPAVQKYYAGLGHVPSIAELLDADSDDEPAFMQGGRGRRLYDDHYSNDFNHNYENRNRQEKGRNPKSMRITEVLAEKFAESLQLADKSSLSSSSTSKASNNKRDDHGNSNNKKSAAEDYSSQNLQRKDRFERCQMEGDITQLGLHKSFFVEGVRIGWPYPSILTPQRQMAIHLVKALKNSRHVVLESPTGTGKSAAILCAVLAWQRHYAKSHWGKTVMDPTNLSKLAMGLMGLEPTGEKFPRIIYCSRTHSQVAQMVSSLKKTPYRPRMTVLGSRDRLCIHSNIRDKNASGQKESTDQTKQQQRKSRVNVNTACQMRVANTEKMRKQLWGSFDFRYDDNRPPERLPGDGEGNQAQQESDDEDEDGASGERQLSSEWILKKSTKKLTCPHYRQLSSYRTAQMTRTSFVANQDTIDCCKVGGEKTKLGAHDIEDLVAFGVNPYLQKDVALYRSGPGSFGIDVGGDCKIRKIRKDTPAEFCGQLRPDDKILAINGKKVKSVKEIEREITSTTADLLELTVSRGASTKAMQAPSSTYLGKETMGGIEVALYRSLGEASFGMTLEACSTGCKINGMKAGPALRNGNVKKDDVIIRVNGKNVEGVNFEEVVKEITATVSDPLRLTLRRQSKDVVAGDAGSDSDDGDQEDLYSPHSPCPYYLSRELSMHAELLFAPYNYILDPGIRAALDINLEGAVVVLDEAHNVEGTLTESGSGKFGEIELSHLVAKLSFYATAARSHNNAVELNGGDKKDISEIAHELLLFVEKLVLHMRDLKSRFEQSSGNIGAQKAIDDYHRFNTPDNTEFEVSYHGPNGHGVHRKAVGCKPFLDPLKISSNEIARLLEYSQAMESHLVGSDKGTQGDGGEKTTSNTFDLLNGLLSKFSLASQTPEHFYIACVVQANGNFDHAAGVDDENNQSRGRRFKKKPANLPFIHPRSAHNPTAALPVCNHEKCKQASTGATIMPSYSHGVRHGHWCDGRKAPQWEAHLVLKLLFPGLLMKDLSSKCRTVVLASGSLSPLQSVCAELNLQDSATSKSGRLQTKPRPLEANHVVNLPRQLLAVAIGTFPNGTPLTVNYSNYSKNPEFFPRLGDAIAAVVESIPRGGVLVFFPSYSVLNKCVKCWNPFDAASSRFGSFDRSDHSCPEIWERFQRSKGKVIVEPTGSQELFEAARDEYAESIRSEGSCLLLAVFRGKMSEGISFNDDNARGVICVGIPFPQLKDRAIVAKKAYNDEQRRLNKRTDLLPGSDWYAQEAFRAIAQALGRCIRHEADYGTVVLMDSRHCHDGSPGFVHSKLPKWMRHSVRTLSPGNMGRGHNPILQGYRGLRQEMQEFFSQAPAYADSVLEKRRADFAAAQEREKQGASHKFNSKTGSWTPSAKGKSAPPGGGCGSAAAAMRVTQDSPVPPQMAASSSAGAAAQPM